MDPNKYKKIFETKNGLSDNEAVDFITDNMDIFRETQVIYVGPRGAIGIHPWEGKYMLSLLTSYSYDKTEEATARLTGHFSKTEVMAYLINYMLEIELRAKLAHKNPHELIKCVQVHACQMLMEFSQLPIPSKFSQLKETDERWERLGYSRGYASSVIASFALRAQEESQNIEKMGLEL